MFFFATLKLLKTDFLKNASVLFSGSLVAQLIGFGSLFIIGRLYSPNDVGELEIILKISAVFVAIAGLRYEMAIVVEDDYNDAQELTRLSLFLNGSISIFLLLLIVILKSQLSQWLNLNNSNFLFFIPAISWLAGSTEAIIQWRNREKKYKTISTNRIATSGAATAYKISHPFLKLFTSNGLILGHTIGLGIGLIHIIYKIPFRIIRFSKINIARVAKRYRSFPFYSAPGAILNIISTSLPVFLITLYDGQDATGHFAFAYKLSYLPLSMLAMALGQVYFERLSRNKNNNSESSELSYELLKIMLAIVAVPCIILFLWGEELATFLLGNKWSVAGKYIEATILFYTAMFITNPFFNVFDVYKKLKIELIFNLLFMALTGAAMILAYRFHGSTLVALQWFSVVGVLLRIGILQYFFKLVGTQKITFLLLILSILGVGYYFIQFNG